MLYIKIHGGKNPVGSWIQLVPRCGLDTSSPTTWDAAVQLGPASAGAHVCLPAGVACDGVPALVLVDVDALHVPLCEDVAGAVGQAWGERRWSHLSHTCCPPTRPGETRWAGSPGGLGGLAGCLSS